MKVLDEFANKCEENTEIEDDETTKKKQRLEMMQKQKEVDEFMLAVDRMKQGEKGLYKPLSSKFKKLAIVSRLVFATKDAGAEEGKGGDGVEEEKNADFEEEKVAEGNKKDNLGSPSVFCAMDLAKTFEY